MLRIDELVFYRDHTDGVLDTVSRLQKTASEAGKHASCVNSCVREYCALMKEMTETAENYGFSGNVWHSWLTYYLVYHENAYSRAHEIR